MNHYQPLLDTAGKPVPFKIAYPEKDEKGNFLSHPTAASVTATYLSNTSTSARSGTVTIAGQSITANQAGQTPTICTFSASPSSVATLPASGGSTTFTVSASPIGCGGGYWTASVSDASWMSESPGSGTTAA